MIHLGTLATPLTRCMSLIRRLQEKDILEEIHCGFDLSIYVCHGCFRELLTTFDYIASKNLNKEMIPKMIFCFWFAIHTIVI